MRTAIRAIRAKRSATLWLFGAAFLAQFGHLLEHIIKDVTGAGVLGAAFDNEISHLAFNGLLAVVAVVLVILFPRNPWVYPLAILASLHGAEHLHGFGAFLRTGLSDGPGLLGLEGAIGIVPLGRFELHNFYNGLELIFMTLGVQHEIEAKLTTGDRSAPFGRAHERKRFECA